ncbi:MAG: hypothetical protein Q8R05_00200 [Candidatus Omnitrophota bacterium]|nr:hypothetical protein [Candidatus Omnitrophota bacterium]
MKSTAVTNLLLTLIAILLLANLLAKLPVTKVEAETFKLDDCITANPGDKPAAYVHVITDN